MWPFVMSKSNVILLQWILPCESDNFYSVRRMSVTRSFIQFMAITGWITFEIIKRDRIESSLWSISNHLSNQQIERLLFRASAFE